MNRIFVAAAGLLLLAACSGGGNGGPAMSAEPTNIGNNTAGVFQPNDRPALGPNVTGAQGVTTNGTMNNPSNSGGGS